MKFAIINEVDGSIRQINEGNGQYRNACRN